MNPPLGLATVLAMLPEDKFEPQRIIDLNVESLNDRLIEESDIVFTSSMNLQEDSQKEINDMARHYGKPVVAGGPFPTSYPERNKADYIVAGEAEMTLLPLLEDLVNGTAKRRDIYTPKKVRDRIQIPLAKNGFPELSQTPVPRWDLVDLSQYVMASIQYSRGCPFNCEFCDITKLFGKITRTKSSEQMTQEINALYNAGFRGTLFFVDDNLIGNKSNLRKFLPELIQWQKERLYPYSILTQASMDLAWDNNQDILDGMVNAGFTQVFAGIESLDKEVIEAMKKSQNLKMPPLEAVRKIQNAGIEVMAGIIIGSDGEKPDVFENIYSFIQKAGIPVVMPGLLVPIQGTDLYSRLQREGRLRENQTNSNTHAFSLDFEPKLAKGFTEQDLIKGYKDFLIKVNSDKAYYQRCRTLQKNRGNPVASLTKPDSEGRKAFARFLKHQLSGNLTWETVKYLTETLVTDPGYFAQAAGDAMKQSHFKQITKEAIRADDYRPEINSWYNDFATEAGRIYERYGNDFQRARKLVSAKARKLVARAEKTYYSLHKDFRGKATNVLEDLKRRLQKTRRSESDLQTPKGQD